MLEGPYTNYSKILYKAFELVSHFDLDYPENEEAELYT